MSWIDPGAHKTHAGPTPYLGGVAVAAGLLVIGWLSAGANGQLLVVVGGALVLGFVGLLDDVQPVSPWIRLAYQVVAAISLWLVGVRAGVFDATWIDLPITVMWVVAVTNAFNFIDNMDGIAAGVAAASALGIAAIAGFNGDYLVTSLALATAGAALGFLRYNVPPARIFLGDAGSMLLGFMVAALILKLDLPVGPPAPRVLSTVLLAGVPLFDLSVVVIARLRDRRPYLARQHGPHIAPDGRRRSFPPPGARLLDHGTARVFCPRLHGVPAVAGRRDRRGCGDRRRVVAVAGDLPSDARVDRRGRSVRSLAWNR